MKINSTDKGPVERFGPQRVTILNYLSNHQGESITAQEIWIYLNKKYGSKTLSRAGVISFVNFLSSVGILIKIEELGFPVSRAKYRNIESASMKTLYQLFQIKAL